MKLGDPPVIQPVVSKPRSQSTLKLPRKHEIVPCGNLMMSGTRQDINSGMRSSYEWMEGIMHLLFIILSMTFWIDGVLFPEFDLSNPTFSDCKTRIQRIDWGEVNYIRLSGYLYIWLIQRSHRFDYLQIRKVDAMKYPGSNCFGKPKLPLSHNLASRASLALLPYIPHICLYFHTFQENKHTTPFFQILQHQEFKILNMVTASYAFFEALVEVTNLTLSYHLKTSPANR